MGSRRNTVAIVSVLVTLAALAILLRPRDGGAGDDPRVSTFLRGPGGAGALYVLMEELGIDASRQLAPWSADSSPRALVVLAPVQAPGPRELEDLRAWIEDGGTLIYAAGGAMHLDRMLGLQLGTLLPDGLSPLETVRWAGTAALPAHHPWTSDIDSVTGFTRAFLPTSRALRDSAGTVLLRTRDGRPTVVALDVGDGSVIAWSDATVLANRPLRTDGAALLFARVAAAVTAGDSNLRFDEYHHGFREASPMRALAAVLTGTGGGRALLQGLAAAIALLLFFGARFGAPVREHSERRRSPLEHVRALAGAYERADARNAARRLLLAGLERRLGRRVFRSSDAIPPAALDASLAGRRLRHEWGRGDDGDLAELSAAVDEFVMEVRR